MIKVDIQDSKFAEISVYSARGSYEGVSIQASDKTKWYKVVENGKMVGCGGLLMMGGVVRIKGLYIEKDKRGKGYGTILTNYLLARAQDFMASCVEVLTYKPSVYEKLGFKITGTMPNGDKKMRRNI